MGEFSKGAGGPSVDLEMWGKRRGGGGREVRGTV